MENYNNKKFSPQRTPHIGEVGGQRNSSEGKRREEKGKSVNGHGSLYLIFFVSV